MSVSLSFRNVADHAIGAAVEIDKLSRNRLTEDPHELTALTQALDGSDPSDVTQFSTVLARCGFDKPQTTDDVWSCLHCLLVDLRTIEVFGIGNLVRARDFCLACSDLYLKEVATEMRQSWLFH